MSGFSNVAHHRACPGGSVTGSYNAAATVTAERRAKFAAGSHVVHDKVHEVVTRIRSDDDQDE